MNAPLPHHHSFADANRFAAFIWLFAAFSIVHEILDARRWATHGIDVISASVIAMLAAGLVLARPSSAWRVAVMAAALLYVKIDDMPFTPNHVLFTSLICLGLLVLAIVKGRTGAWLDVGSRTLGPAVRVAVCIVYGYAVLHKLNTDYFDPEFSCGPLLFRQLRGYLPFLPSGSWIDWPAIVGSLLTEGGLGLLLLFRRTRTPAIAVGLVFHALLAFHPNVYIMSFSTLIIPLYALFLPLPFYGRIARLASRLPPLLTSPGIVVRHAPLAVVVLLIAFGAFHVIRDANPDPGTRYELLTNALGPIPRGVSLAFVFAASGVFYLVVAMKPRAMLDFDEAPRERARVPGVAGGCVECRRRLQRPLPLPRAQDADVVLDVLQPPHRGEADQPLLHAQPRPDRAHARPGLDRRGLRRPTPPLRGHGRAHPLLRAATRRRPRHLARVHDPVHPARRDRARAGRARRAGQLPPRPRGVRPAAAAAAEGAGVPRRAAAGGGVWVSALREEVAPLTLFRRGQCRIAGHR
jgi:hypothetical protein